MSVAENHTMEEPGQKLKRARERLNLRVRDVEEASMKIAGRHRNDEFAVAISRISDIENKGVVPTIFRLYSLCAIYRLDMTEVMEWYGVDMSQLTTDAACIEVERTHEIGFSANGHGEVQVPLALDPGIDVRRTTFLSRMIQRWGRLPLMLLNSLELKNFRYGYVGTDDWTMYPLIMPGSLVIIDETRRKVASSGWKGEYDRPVYFLEHRDGFLCCWCSVINEETLITQPHPASDCIPQVFRLNDEVDIIGQVTGVATRLDQARKRRTRS